MIAKQSIGLSFTGALSYNLKKMNDPDPKQRAELLFTNFASMDKSMIRSELAMMKALNPKLRRNTWHTSLNFAKEENISNEKMKAIAEAYMKRMGFDNNLHIIFRHHDTGHPHCHILALRNRFDGTVVSDSHNYQKSEAIIRALENEYNLVKVLSSNQSQSKAPDKDELEMILRTGKPSMKLLLQEKVRDALAHSLTMRQFIHNLEKNNVHVLFNQASTGRVSGITYLVPGFKIRGQALGNQFKFGSITKQINYEQNRDGKIISQANSRTREKFGSGTKEGFSTNISGIGIPYSKQWYYYATTSGICKISPIPFGLIDQNQGGEFKLDQRSESNQNGSKENPVHPDIDLSYNRSTPLSIFGKLADLLDIQVTNSPDKKRDKERKRGISR